MKKILAKLNENYGNDFLTLNNGQVFYNKGNSLKKEANIEEVDLSNQEVNHLISQQTLVIVEQKEEPKKEIKPEVKKEVKEIEPEVKINPKPKGLTMDNLN